MQVVFLYWLKHWIASQAHGFPELQPPTHTHTAPTLILSPWTQPSHIHWSIKPISFHFNFLIWNFSLFSTLGKTSLNYCQYVFIFIEYSLYQEKTNISIVLLKYISIIYFDTLYSLTVNLLSPLYAEPRTGLNINHRGASFYFKVFLVN